MPEEKELMSVKEEMIEGLARAVSELIPEDFKAMSGLKVPTDAEDGEMVKVVLVGRAAGGMLKGIYGAECDYDEAPSEKPKGRIKIMIMGGNKEEEE